MEWINVNDRLPQNEEHIIGYCTTKINPIFHVEPLLFQIHNDGKFTWSYLFAYNEGYGYATNVTHWMLLPDPPKGPDEVERH